MVKTTHNVEPNPYTFYTSAEYYTALVQHINATKKGDRVTLATLFIRPTEPRSAAVLNAANQAAARGVQVTLIVDDWTFLIKTGISPGPSFFYGKPKKPMTKAFRSRLTALEALKAAGGRYFITNPTKRALASPISGRSHIKYSVVNDTVFIGGCNLGDTELLDVMVSWNDVSVADWLQQLAEYTMQTGSVAKALQNKDASLPTNNHATLLVDAGVKGQSIIFDRALRAVDTAKNSVYITFQYFPDHAMADSLQAAEQRGADVRIVYNSAGVHTWPLNHIYGQAAKRTLRGRSKTFTRHQLPAEHPYIHAKVIIADGTTILSSHNYMPDGVRLGTAEIGLISEDPSFAGGVQAALKRQSKFL